jgi:nucleoside-diphosphate-sugar epimerase
MAKVLLTGGTGFIGANLVRSLLARGDEVHLFVRGNSNLWRLDGVKGKLSFHELDITNAAEVTALFDSVKPDTVFHLAVQGSNPAAKEEADRMVFTNVEGTKNILNACAKLGCTFVNTGSSSEYGLKNTPMREGDAVAPNTLYGTTKAEGTSAVHALAAKERLPMVTLRLFSPFGYFDHPHRLIPALILNALHKRPSALYSPSARRDFIFIEDVTAAYLFFAGKAAELHGEIVNIGSGVSHSVAETVAAIETITGTSLQASYGAAAAKQAEPEEWVADIKKAASLGWTPAASFEEGLEKTVAWFNDNASLYS